MSLLPLNQFSLFLVGWVLIFPPLAASEEITAARQTELLYLLKHDCGSCLGMRLNGGLGPALSALKLQNWNIEQLALTILYGRPGTPMPPWQAFLTSSEARWLADRLKQGPLPRRRPSLYLLPYS